MNCLVFLFLVTFSLVVCRLTWTAYQYASSDGEESLAHCECLCHDYRFDFADMKITMRYSGTMKSRSCACEEFLLPKLYSGHIIPTERLNKTCEICKCRTYNGLDCLDGTIVNFTTVFDIITATVLGITLVYLLMTALENILLVTQELTDKVSTSSRDGGSKSSTNYMLLNPRESEQNKNLDVTQNQKTYKTFHSIS